MYFLEKDILDEAIICDFSVVKRLSVVEKRLLIEFIFTINPNWVFLAFENP